MLTKDDEGGDGMRPRRRKNRRTPAHERRAAAIVWMVEHLPRDPVKAAAGLAAAVRMIEAQAAELAARRERFARQTARRRQNAALNAELIAELDAIAAQAAEKAPTISSVHRENATAAPGLARLPSPC